MGDKCVENIPVTKYIDFPREDEGADREPVAPALKATISWLRQAGELRAASKTAV